MFWTAATLFDCGGWSSRRRFRFTVPGITKENAASRRLAAAIQMIRSFCLTLMVLMGLVIGDLFSTWTSVAETASADDADPALQPPLLRVAIVAFAPATASHKPGEVALAEALSRDGRVALIDPSIVRSAL